VERRRRRRCQTRRTKTRPRMRQQPTSTLFASRSPTYTASLAPSSSRGTTSPTDSTPASLWPQVCLPRPMYGGIAHNLVNLWLVDSVKALRPTRHKIGHSGGVFPSQSLGIVQKKLTQHDKSKSMSSPDLKALKDTESMMCWVTWGRRFQRSMTRSEKK